MVMGLHTLKSLRGTVAEIKFSAFVGSSPLIPTIEFNISYVGATDLHNLCAHIKRLNWVVRQLLFSVATKMHNFEK